MNLLSIAKKKFLSILGVSGRGFVYKLVRGALVLFAKQVCKNGIRKNIGRTGFFLMSPEFILSDFKNWGMGHNNAFKKMLELAKRSDVVFDVGAHIGLCSLPISRILKGSGVCYAFEPSTLNYGFFTHHVTLNKIDNVTVLPDLVGDKCLDKVEFFEGNECSGMNSVCSPQKKMDISFKKTFKKQITLDHFVEKTGKIPDLIKIDVEGAELFVLEGAKKMLLEHHPKIILSVHPRQIKALGYSVEELSAFIKKMGYRVFDVDESSFTGKLEFKEYFLTTSLSS